MIIKQNKHSFAAWFLCRWRNRRPLWRVNLSLEVSALSGMIFSYHHVFLSSHPPPPSSMLSLQAHKHVAFNVKTSPSGYKMLMSAIKVLLPHDLPFPLHWLNRLHTRQENLNTHSSPMLKIISIGVVAQSPPTLLFNFLLNTIK